MAAKQKSSRSTKKEVVSLFEKSFDLEKLNYARRSQAIKPKSMLIGLGIASALYFVGFLLAYLAMSNNVLPLDGFAKLVWIMMIPTTIVGVLAWQIAKNRMEYPLRTEITAYIGELEKNGGLIWKFQPLLDIVDGGDLDTKNTLAKSRAGKSEELAVEDYTDAIKKLYQLLVNTENRQFSTSIAEAVLDNFGKA